MRDLLKIEYPIIQAPMAGSDDAKFVAAASNSGVLGSLGAQYRTPDEITKVIAEIRALTDKPFAVNLFALNTLLEPVDSQIEECRSALKDDYDRFQISAPSKESIKNIIDPHAQLQAILDAKVPVISVDAVNIAVIAAGGIMDGRGIAAALALGAAGVQMGTAFLTTTECPVQANYKRAIREHDADDTIITKVFSGGAARVISNEFTSKNQQTPLLPFPFHNALTRPIRQIANVLGLIEFTNFWSGQNGRLAKELSVGDLVERLVAEANSTLASMSGKQI